MSTYSSRVPTTTRMRNMRWAAAAIAAASPRAPARMRLRCRWESDTDSENHLCHSGQTPLSFRTQWESQPVAIPHCVRNDMSGRLRDAPQRLLERIDRLPALDQVLVVDDHRRHGMNALIEIPALLFPRLVRILVRRQDLLRA